MIALFVINAVVAAVSTFFAARAFHQPHAMIHADASAVTEDEKFYAAMYAARGGPFGILTAVAPFLGSGAPVSAILFGAATIQLADAGLGARRGKRQMIIGATFAALVHITAAVSCL